MPHDDPAPRPQAYSVLARALERDIDLDKFAAALRIERKSRWEEPLRVAPDTLMPVPHRAGPTPRVVIYAFGSVVFLNCTSALVDEFHRRASQISGVFDAKPSLPFDDYTLTTGAELFEVTNDDASVPGTECELVDTVCLVLAKSVALERIERGLDRVFDEIEHLIDYLSKGRLRYPDDRMAKLTSMILSLQYTSLAHVMVLDTPEFAWENVDVDRLYRKMSNMFELTQRYHEIEHKSSTLLDVTQVFSTLSHARRSTRLEVIVIVLILIEVVIYVVELVARRG